MKRNLNLLILALLLLYGPCESLVTIFVFRVWNGGGEESDEEMCLYVEGLEDSITQGGGGFKPGEMG
jgi:hypothetical protein